MKRILFILLIPAIALLSSCNKRSIVEPENGGTMNDLVVPADFNWKTTQTLDILVTLPSTGDIHPLIITNRDGSVRYFRGFPDDGSRTVKTKITIPAYLIDLRFIYNGANGPNVAYINGSTVTYDFNTVTKSVDVVTCNLEGFVTYSKGGWGQTSNGNNVGALRDQYFDNVYTSDFIVGNTNKYTITFNATGNVKNYLPGKGGPKVLKKDWVNPVPNNKLGNMADQIIAARLNRDYNQAGYLGTNPDYTLGELVYIDGPFQGMTVNAFLIMAETALGGGPMGNFSAEQYKNGAESIILSFHNGNNGNVLTCPPDPTQDDPYVEISSNCSEPDVIFTISNTGDGDMTSAYAYTVYKNDVELQSGTYELDENEMLYITVTGTSSDIFKIVVETPRSVTLENSITSCGSGGGGEQLSGTLAYEDLWPGKGDYDFNDLVIDYDFVITKDNQEIVQNIEVTFTIKAYGASLHNGFAFTLPTVEPGDIESVSGYDIDNSSVFNINSNGLEEGQSKATIVVFDDVRRVMPQTTGGIGVNTQEAYDYIDPVTMVVNIDFVDNAITYNDLNIGSFNPFIVVNSVINGSPGIRGLEIHLPNYAPSDLMDDAYFDTQDDASQPSIGKYFVTANNLPWAINIAEDFDWVIEFQDIAGAYHHFGNWAESGGSNYPDWYKNESGYRNSSLIYTVP